MSGLDPQLNSPLLATGVGARRPLHPLCRLFIALLVGVILGLVFWVGWWVWRHNAYYAESERLAHLIRSLREKRPEGVKKVHWNEGVDWTITAYYASFTGPEYTEFDVMKRFGQSLSEKLQGPVDADFFEWIWDELEKTGPTGKRYVTKYRSSLRESMTSEPDQQKEP